jgi:uncharacterized protein with GYD domain
MARYVILLRFTDQGAQKIKQSAGRAHHFREEAEKAGIKVEAQLWTAGSCDGVLILSGEEKNILRSLGRLAEQGNVRTEALRAFDEEEFRSIDG